MPSCSVMCLQISGSVLFIHPVLSEKLFFNEYFFSFMIKGTIQLGDWNQKNILMSNIQDRASQHYSSQAHSVFPLIDSQKGLIFHENWLANKDDFTFFHLKKEQIIQVLVYFSVLLSSLASDILYKFIPFPANMTKCLLNCKFCVIVWRVKIIV